MWYKYNAIILHKSSFILPQKLTVSELYFQLILEHFRISILNLLVFFFFVCLKLRLFVYRIFKMFSLGMVFSMEIFLHIFCGMLRKWDVLNVFRGVVKFLRKKFKNFTIVSLSEIVSNKLRGKCMDIMALINKLKIWSCIV